MIAPTKLAKWRESQEPALSPKMAARFFRITPAYYAMLERGEGECTPALAMEIATRTKMAVLPGDLPGCGIETSSEAGPRSALPAADGGEAAPAVSPPIDVFLVQGDQAGEYRVAMRLAANGPLRARTRQLDAREAADLGLELIRAALLAARPGSVPS